MQGELSTSHTQPTRHFGSPQDIGQIIARAHRMRGDATTQLVRAAARGLKDAAGAVIDWLSRRRDVDLLDLDDRMLKDIGLTRSDALMAHKRHASETPPEPANSNRPSRAA